MAGSSSTYQQAVVTMVEEFLKAIDELTNETKARLSKLSEISEVAASIEKDKGEVKDTSRVHNCISLIKNFLTGLLFGPYTELLSKLADSFSMVKELENKQKEDKSFQLPEVMQARIDSFKHYLEKAKGRLEGIDKVLDELIDKVSRLLSSLSHDYNRRFCAVHYHYSLFNSVVFFSGFSWG